MSEEREDKHSGIAVDEVPIQIDSVTYCMSGTGDAPLCSSEMHRLHREAVVQDAASTDEEAPYKIKCYSFWCSARQSD
jgi:hypothetical protein